MQGPSGAEPTAGICEPCADICAAFVSLTVERWHKVWFWQSRRVDVMLDRSLLVPLPEQLAQPCTRAAAVSDPAMVCR